jgi:ABC-2 type transport system permease protein
MLKGLLALTWLEIKIFVREPLGLIGSVAVPVASFVILGRLIGGRPRQLSEPVTRLLNVQIPVLAVLLISLSAVLSLITIVAIYRESGILKRLRATPLRPHTILTAQVLVKLAFTLVTMALLLLAGKRYYPVNLEVPMVSSALALAFSTVAIMSMGFLIASLVPTARFAQPMASLVLYPMLGLCGLFAPIADLPPALRAIARVLPLTYAASLLKGIWVGEPWSAHGLDLAALLVTFVVCTVLATKVFRWE